MFAENKEGCCTCLVPWVWRCLRKLPDIDRSCCQIGIILNRDIDESKESRQLVAYPTIFSYMDKLIILISNARALARPRSMRRKLERNQSIRELFVLVSRSF